MHLNLEEDAVYRRLIDHAYDTEAPISDVKTLCRRLRAPEELTMAILNEFFVQTEKGWVSPRVESDLKEMKDASERAREHGKKGGRKPNPNPAGFKKEPNPKLPINPLTHKPNNLIPPTPAGGSAPEALSVEQFKSEILLEPAESTAPIADTLAEFEEFWNLHPKKRSKIECQRQWIATTHHRPPFSELLEIIKNQYNASEWKADGWKYAPSSLTYLSDHRWHDVLATAQKRPLGSFKAQEDAVDELAARRWAVEQFGDPDDIPFREWPRSVQQQYRDTLKIK